MKISSLLAENKTTFSFEFSPPRTPEAAQTLFETIRELTPLEPSYVSVTYGAGGSTRDLTRELVVRLQRESGLTVAAHLTCVNASRDEIHQILDGYHEQGIQNIMALRGDPPGGGGQFVPHEHGFAHAGELVRFIKQHYPDMCVGVAGYPEGHPETPNRLVELDNLKAKTDEGADFICTQLFFDNRDFYDFRERCELAGIHAPIIAGIMPITSRATMVRMADLAKGARYPAKLLRALARAENDEGFLKVGAHWATQQVLDLLDHGVRGIHFYTLNRSRITRMIYEQLGVSRSSNLI
jgi:methylenetetrahydrofolate reductase (NADPH)